MSKAPCLLALFLAGMLLCSCGGSGRGSAGTTADSTAVSAGVPAVELLSLAEVKVDVEVNNPLFDNNIVDTMQQLAPIYEKLYALKSAPHSDTKLTIVHIGDSHLQAGFLNGTVMKLLQQEFGNAGRGLIFPLKIAHTNEPNDYFIESAATWNVSKCVTRKMPFAVGLGGLSIMTDQPDFTLSVGIEPNDEIDYSFDRIRVFHHPRMPVLRANTAASTQSTRSMQRPFVTDITFPDLTRSVEFLAHTPQVGDSSIVYGFSLERSDPGVIYHAIGVNSAQFNSYLRIADFAEQISSLNPDLIIFSLGTNEAFNDRINRKTFANTIDRLVGSLTRAIPSSKVLISTPAECQRRYEAFGGEFRPNELIPIVSGVLIDYASKKGYPYWDLFNITGGKNSSQWWIENHYLAKDRVHFYPSGYKYQGELLYQAIINGYNNYVSHRS